jgi:hypothetical protein
VEGEAGDQNDAIDRDGQGAIRDDAAEAGGPAVIPVRVVFGQESVEGSVTLQLGAAHSRRGLEVADAGDVATRADGNGLGIVVALASHAPRPAERAVRAIAREKRVRSTELFE